MRNPSDADPLAWQPQLTPRERFDRPQLCQLLALITRRKHVTPYRVQLLLGLVRQTGGGDQSLIGLLRVLKNYYPEIIVGPATRGRASAFKVVDLR